MRWVGLPLEQMGEVAHAALDAPSLLRFFERVEGGEWEALLEEYTATLRRHPDPARRHFAARGDWARARTMRDHNGDSWDEDGGTKGRLPPQYALRRVQLSPSERAWLVAQPLPDTADVTDVTVDERQGPPARDAWLRRRWRRSRNESAAAP
jgi:hypothetical protein